MRLAIKMLGRSTTVNDVKYVSTVEIERGETLDLMFQLINADNGQRYIPASGTTVQVQLPRYLEYIPSIIGEAVATDYSVNQASVQAFPGDASIWTTPLASSQTAQLTSQNMRIVITEGSKISIAVAQYAIKIYQEHQ